MATTDSKATRFAVRFLVHKSSVGPLIGKSGEVIQSINTKSGAAIGIEDAPSERRLVDAIRDRVMTVFFSDNTQLEAAIAELAPILKASREDALKDFKEPKEVPQNEQLFTALIHSAGVAALLTAEGAEIRKVQQETGASIRIRDRLPQSSESPIQFKGSLEQVTKAVIATLDHLLNRSEDYRRYIASLAVSKEDQWTERSISVATEQIPFILGREGRRAKEIKRRTSCIISIPENKATNGKTIVVVKGPSRNVNIAIHMVLRSKTLGDKIAAQKQ